MRDDKEGVWKLCNMDSGSGVEPEGWRTGIIVPMYADRGEITYEESLKFLELPFNAFR